MTRRNHQNYLLYRHQVKPILDMAGGVIAWAGLLAVVYGLVVLADAYLNSA